MSKINYRLNLGKCVLVSSRTGPLTCFDRRVSLLVWLQVLFVTCLPLASNGAINLGPIFDGGQYWIPRTYTDHVPSGWSNAVDFYWIDPQAPNSVRSATQHATDGYDAAADLGRGKNVHAAHSGVAQLINYKFAQSDCAPIGAQPEIKISSGGLTTYYIHLETAFPIQVNDSVTVYSKQGYLNLRAGPSTSMSIFTAMPDGTRLNVIGGPTFAEGYTWWNVQGKVGSGWAVESIASRKTLVNSLIHRSKKVVVVGNLNLRPNASVSSEPAVLMAGGTEMAVIGGPVQADGYTWWQLTGSSGTGWAVDAIPSSTGADLPTLGVVVQAGDVIGYVSDEGCADRPHLMFLVQNPNIQPLNNGNAVTLNGEVIFSGPSRSDGYNIVYNSMPRSVQPDVIRSLVATPASGVNATTNQNLQLNVNVDVHVNSPGILQLWLYDSGFGTSVRDWVYLEAAKDGIVTLNGLNFTSGAIGQRNYTIYAQFRPNATTGPILDDALGDSILYANYSVNWQAPGVRTLSVSSISPDSGVTIGVTPSDTNGLSDGSTIFTRRYFKDTVVYLDAPASVSGNSFVKWQRSGLDWSVSRTTFVTMDADYNMTAIYQGIDGIVAVATGLRSPVALALDQSNVYWTEGGNGVVRSISKSGGTPTTLASGLSGPAGICADASYMYFTEDYAVNAANVKRVPKSGGSVTTLASGLHGVGMLAQDSDNLYWTDPSGGKIMRLPKAGGSAATLASGISWPLGIVVDNLNVYWSEDVSGGRVRKVPKVGGLVTEVGFYSQTLGVDVHNDYVYWTDGLAGALKRAPASGGNSTTIRSSLSSPANLVVDDSSVFWLSGGLGGSLQQVGVAGGPAITLATGLNEASAMALDTGYIYWIEHGTSFNTGVLKKAPKGTLPTDVIAPAVVIATPTSAGNFVTSGTSLKISGTSSDSFGITTVSWTNDRGGSGQAVGTTAWSIESIPLQRGVNRLTVSAQDAAGNVGSSILWVTSATPPQIANTHRDGNTLTLGFQTISGVNYALEYKNSLNDANWTLVQTVVGDGALTSIADSSASARRFYRIRIQ